MKLLCFGFMLGAIIGTAISACQQKWDKATYHLLVAVVAGFLASQ